MATQNLISLGRDFAEWRRDSGVLAARLREIDERVGQLENGEAENFTADTVVKYMVPDEWAEQAAAEFDEWATVYAEIAQGIRNHNNVWALVATTMRTLPTPENNEPGPGHAEKPGEQE